MKKSSASDYINAKKQNAIYSELNINVNNFNKTPNPLKLNGGQYNNNVIVYDTSCNTFNNIKFAKSYDLIMNYNRGKEYSCIRCEKNQECFEKH
jgi:hypothetical protein